MHAVSADRDWRGILYREDEGEQASANKSLDPSDGVVDPEGLVMPGDATR